MPLNKVTLENRPFYYWLIKLVFTEGEPKRCISCEKQRVFNKGLSYVPLHWPWLLVHRGYSWVDLK